MKMTKMLLLGLSFILTIGLQAQTEKPATQTAPTSVEAPQMRTMPKADRVERRQARREALLAKLNLSQEQTTQFDAINQNYHEQMRELRQKSFWYGCGCRTVNMALSRKNWVSGCRTTLGVYRK